MSEIQSIKGRNIDWGLYRHFLAVADTGSLTAAAKELGVSQPTVGRQIQSLEKVMDARLFDRDSNGYVLTPAGEAILELAQAIHQQAMAIERRIAGEDRRLEGCVRISAAEGLATYWLPERLASFHKCYPQIEIELIVRSAALDLMRREADIVMRIGEPRANDLVGRRIGKIHFGLFATEGYLASNGVPEKPDDIAQHHIIESIGAIENLAQARRLREIAGRVPTAIRCDNLLTQFAALQTGIGIMAVPLYMASTVPGLQRVLPKDFDVVLDLWLLTHRDLRPLARISAVFEFLAEAICQDQGRFTGTTLLSHP